MNKDKPSANRQTAKKDFSRNRTQVPGQNPKANDAPDHDLHHDESRRNEFDPEVGKALTGSAKKAKHGE